MFILVRHHVTFRLRLFNPWQANFASYEELAGSSILSIFLLLLFSEKLKISVGTLFAYRY